ncbi:MORC family CW-type zinc finger protein 3 [Nothobranchius furzeri]|uniref:MORC family CW-type zinc finger protein 3 n=1 Tax=Nothobranchius furzeri TaxID=105023 RepID=UPI0039047937
MARLSEQGIRLSSMSPSFLNSNSTSHTWPFSAVAELIDNAADPGVLAKQIWIDVATEGDQLCLTFTDNGNGMTPNKLHKMLSFGFTEKGTGKASQQAIGLYGNGFKSGSMRLGRDVLIFTKNGGCQTVGLLSQTYLENIKAQAVIVPIVPFSQQTKSLVVTEDSEASLAAIFQHSIISSQEQILAHFDSITSKKGTKILIWNIRRAKDGKTEIDYDLDSTDFRLPEIQIKELKQGLWNSGLLRPEQNLPDMYYSLRAYISILYLRPKTQVILRGKKVLAKLVSKSLTHIEHDVYNPQFSKEKVKVTFGLNPKRKEHYGIMMYHKNRLIKAYEKVGCQLTSSGQRAGIGIIGIVECNFLKPAHNKQDFEYTKEYRLTLGAMGLKLNDYWREVTEKKAKEREFQALEKGDDNLQEGTKVGSLWLQCEDCLKWRSVPPDHYKVTPENWTCSQNPNSRHRKCSSPEESEESEELLTPSYQKNHKKLELFKSRKRDKSLEVCPSEEPTAKQQILSHSPSESPSTHRPEHTSSDTQELKHHETSTHILEEAHRDEHTNDTQAQLDVDTDEREMTKQDEALQLSITPTTHVENYQRLEDKERSSESETRTETRQKEEEEQHADPLSHKRKPESVFNYAMKKRWRQQQSDPENISEDSRPGKQTNTFRKAIRSHLDKSIPLQQSSTSSTWTYSPLATQTVMVSPLSRTKGPQGRTLPPEGGDRNAKVQKLAALEREAQRLQRLLGLEVTKTTQSTVTADQLPDSNKGGLVRTVESRASRDIGCQTVNAEQCSTSVSGLTAGLENRSKKEKTEDQSKTTVSDGEACDDLSPVQQSLHDIRHNVVVLLTALLPQLDLAGISVETADVDNILQQIIEVNSLQE